LGSAKGRHSLLHGWVAWQRWQGGQTHAQWHVAGVHVLVNFLSYIPKNKVKRRLRLFICSSDAKGGGALR